MQIPAVGVEPLGLSGRRSIVVLAWFFGVQLLFGALLGIGLVIWGRASGQDSHAQLVDLTNTWIVPGTVVGLALSAWVLWHQVRKSFPGAAWPTVKATLGWKPATRGEIWLALASGISLALIYLFILTKVFPPKTGQSFGPMATAAAAAALPTRLLYAAMAIGLAPPLEEFVFRGFLLAGFGRSWGLKPAVVVITLLFTAGHLSEVRSYWPAAFAIAVLACGTMAFRLGTRSLWPAIGMHAAYNAILMLVLLLRAS